MSLLFLSHSSRDNARALALRDWLASEGWTEIFLDIDPERGIVAGEKWEQALYQAAGRCDTVLFLISRHWLGSEWCRRELHLAQRLNKRIVALLIEPIPVAELPPELTESWQVVNLAAQGEAATWAAEVLLDGEAKAVSFARDGLTRLRVGLHKAGLDPKSFAWPPADDPERPPYRGLKPLEAEDAGIFFGREAPIIELLGQLRGLSEGAPPRFLAILGASGAGKSSFLRAGVLPRLTRDDRHYLPLPVIRPEQAVLSGPNGLLASLHATATRLGLGREAARLPEALAAGAEALAPLLAELATAAAVPDWDGGVAKPPVLVLAIDQGEELFQSDGQDEARRFLDLLGGLLAADRPPLLALFTIRSERYDALQSAPALQEVSQKTFSLPPMPKGAYRQVIEEPAKLLARQGQPLKIEPALTDALLQDLERGGGKDALPLLAFTLERLYRDYGADGDLKREEYDALGRIEGAIESAVDEALKAAQSNPRVPRDRAACLALLRRGLIPWMAGIDPQTNLPRRKVARLAQVPEEARPLIEHFIEHRLLATDRDDGKDTTIEPAHEALLRQWTTLKGWLEEDAAALATLESVQSASRDWEANTRDAKWLVHQTGRLEDAEALLQRDDLAASLDASDHAYLSACREQEDERRDKELRQARELAEAQARTAKRTRIGLVVAMSLAVVATGLGWRAYVQQEIAENQLVEANHNLGTALIEKADGLAAQKRYSTALVFRAEAQPLLKAEARRENADHADVYRQQSMLSVWVSGSQSLHEDEISAVAYARDGVLIATGAKDGSLRVWDRTTGALRHELSEHNQEVSALSFSPDGNLLASASWDETIQLWDMGTGRRLHVLSGHRGSVSTIDFSPDGRQLASGSDDASIIVWDVAARTQVARIEHGLDRVTRVVFSPDGKSLASLHGSTDAVVLENLTDGMPRHRWSVRGPVDLRFRENGRALVVRSAAGQGMLVLDSITGNERVSWDAVLEKERRMLPSITREITTGGSLGGSISPDGQTLVYATGNGLAVASVDRAQDVWRIEAEGDYDNFTFSPDGSEIAAVGRNGQLRLWSASDGRALNAGNAPIGTASSTAVSPNGRYVVSAGSAGSLWVWDSSSGERVATLVDADTASHPPVKDLSFSPNGAWLASADDSGGVILWRFEDRSLVHRLARADGTDAHLGEARSIAFSPDSAILISVGRDESVRFWDTATGRLLRDVPMVDEVLSVAYSADGKHIAVGTEHGLIRVLSPSDGTALRSITLPASQGVGEPPQVMGAITALAFDPLGGRLVSASDDGAIRLWDTTSGELLQTMAEGNAAPNDVAFTQNGLLASAHADSVIRLWDPSDGSLLSILEGHTDSVDSIASQGPPLRLASGSRDGTIRLWQLPTSELANRDFVVARAPSPDGSLWASVSGAGDSLEIRDTRSGILLRALPLSKALGAPLSVSFRGGAGRVDVLRQSGLQALDVSTGRVLKESTLNAGRSFVAWSADGQVSADVWHRELSANDFDELSVRRPIGGEVVRTLVLDARPTAYALSPDGSRIAVGLEDLTVRIWDVDTEREATVLRGHADRIEKLMFAGDGRWLASAGSDDRVLIWDAVDGRAVRELPSLSGTIASMDFNPDASILAVASDGPGVQLLGMRDKQEARILRSAGGEVRLVSFSQDGRSLAVTDWDGWTRHIALDASEAFESVGLEAIKEQAREMGVQVKGRDLVIEPALKPNLLATSEGTGVPLWLETDPLRWMSTAEAGDPEAMQSLGEALLRENDPRQAAVWFEKALKSGQASAEVRLRIARMAIDAAAQADTENRE